MGEKAEVLKAGHTKGDWVVTSDGHYVTPKNASTKIIALVFRPDTDEEAERLANAHLMASAPELLEALWAMVEHFERVDGEERHKAVIAQACKALAKATVSA